MKSIDHIGLIAVGTASASGISRTIRFLGLIRRFSAKSRSIDPVDAFVIPTTARDVTQRTEASPESPTTMPRRQAHQPVGNLLILLCLLGAIAVTGFAHHETPRHLRHGGPAIMSVDHPLSQIHRVRFRHGHTPRAHSTPFSHLFHRHLAGDSTLIWPSVPRPFGGGSRSEATQGLIVTRWVPWSSTLGTTACALTHP